MSMVGKYWKQIAALALLLAVGAWALKRFAPDNVPQSIEKAPTQSPDRVASSAPASEPNSGTASEQFEVSEASAESAPQHPVASFDVQERDRQILKTLHGSGKLQDVLARIQSEGGSESAVFQDFVRIAETTCGRSLERMLLDPVASADEGRRWALAALVETCDGFDSKQFHIPDPKYGLDDAPAKSLAALGNEAATQAAINVVRNSQDSFSLGEAGRVLALAGGFPADLQAKTQWMGEGEKIQAWNLAVGLHQCNLAGGCGSNSIRTLSTCVHVSCRPNADYRSALQSALPAERHAAMMAYLQWMETLKRPR